MVKKASRVDPTKKYPFNTHEICHINPKNKPNNRLNRPRIVNNSDDLSLRGLKIVPRPYGNPKKKSMENVILEPIAKSGCLFAGMGQNRTSLNSLGHCFLFAVELVWNSFEVELVWKKIIQPPQISLNGVIELWKVDQLDLSWEHGQTNNGWQGTWDVRKKKHTHTYIYRICTHGTTKIYVIHLHIYNVFIYIYNNIYI